MVGGSQNDDAPSAFQCRQTHISLPFIFWVPRSLAQAHSPATFSFGCAPGTSTSLQDLTSSLSLLSLNVSKHSGDQDLVFLALVP